MAKIHSPKASRKGHSPAFNRASGNLDKAAPTELTPLNFKVPTEFHREFKAYAARRGVSMLGLLQEGFRLVKEHQI